MKPHSQTQQMMNSFVLALARYASLQSPLLDALPVYGVSVSGNAGLGQISRMRFSNK